MNEKTVDERVKRLESIMDSDQEAIRKLKNGEIADNEYVSIRDNHTSDVISFIREFGFPLKTKTSDKAYKAAIPTILHSGKMDLIHDTAGTILNAKEHEVEKADYAYLIDKWCVNNNVPQKFGTQYRVIDGVITFFLIEGKSTVNERRSIFGLDTLEKYNEFIQKESL